MIVYTEYSSLAADLGFPVKTLFAVSNRLSAHYRKVELPKKDGGTRTLTVPDGLLKKIQRAIGETLLVYEPVSPYACAYRYGGSVQKNAAAHVGKEKVVKLDIRHFFDSILYSAVKEKCFPATRFSEPVRVLLSMLCYSGDALPQGAPTSPLISNIILRDFDETVGQFCRERGISYTRYCDDMTFSGDFSESELIAFVESELFRAGFLLNREKTRILPSGKRQTVTGLVVNEKLNVSAAYRRAIRQEVYYCKKYGVSGHLRKIGNDAGEAAYLRSLLGRISFVLQTLPGDETFSGYKRTVTEWLKKAE